MQAPTTQGQLKPAASQPPPLLAGSILVCFLAAWQQRLLPSRRQTSWQQHGSWHCSARMAATGEPTRVVKAEHNLCECYWRLCKIRAKGVYDLYPSARQLSQSSSSCPCNPGHHRRRSKFETNFFRQLLKSYASPVFYTTNKCFRSFRSPGMETLAPTPLARAIPDFSRPRPPPTTARTV